MFGTVEGKPTYLAGQRVYLSENYVYFSGPN